MADAVRCSKHPIQRQKQGRWPELLAPAGDFAALEAAIASGADAVYLGGADFNARRQAGGFSNDQLVIAIEQAHKHGLFVYLALNTLVHDEELDQALDLAGCAAAAGIDAVILQDTGLAGLLHDWLPELPRHASTQMTVTDRAGLHQASRLGFSRVILARELTLAESFALTEEAAELGLETEIFIHGALCMSLSGQCLLSSLNGGRSGNRGDCAQPCRLPWILTSWNRSRTAESGTGETGQTLQGIRAYPWLSPCDQALLPGIAGLLQSGVAALKIEGRMRRPDYVAQVVAVYREAIDRVMTGQPGTTAEKDLAQQRLLLAYNRGGRFSDRVLSGRMDRSFLAGHNSGNSGLLIGHLADIDAASGRLLIRLRQKTGLLPVRGDVLAVRDQDAADGLHSFSAPAGRIRETAEGLLMQGFHPAVLRRMQPGSDVYLMGSRQADELAKKAPSARTGLTLVLTVQEDGKKITLNGRIRNGPLAGHEATVSLPGEPVSPLLTERVRTQLQKTGGTAYRIADITLPASVPLSIAGINQLRRNLLAALDTLITTGLQRNLPLREKPRLHEISAKKKPAGLLTGLVTAYFHQLPDDPARLTCSADQYILPLLSLDRTSVRSWIEALRTAQPEARILAGIPPSRYGRLSQLMPELLLLAMQAGIDGFAANQARQDFAGLLPADWREQFLKLFWLIDSTANCLNRPSLLSWLQAGADSVCLSPELDFQAILPLVEKAAAEAVLNRLPLIEVAAYGHLSVMRNAFCPVGFNQPDCSRCVIAGKTADANPGRLYAMTDRRGYTFPLLTHPRICQCELLQHNRIYEQKNYHQLRRQLADDALLYARLYFTEESQEERRTVVEAFRRFQRHDK